MDPPDPEVVEDALSLLDHINALEKTSHRGRYELHSMDDCLPVSHCHLMLP